MQPTFLSNSEGHSLESNLDFLALHTMTVWGHIVFWFVCPASLCECNSSEFVGPITFIFGRMIGHRRVVDHIISYHFDSMIVVGVMGL